MQVRVLRASHVYNPLGWLDIPDPYVRMSVSGTSWWCDACLWVLVHMQVQLVW